MKRLKSYLSYNTISGIQIESDGTRIDVIPAYSSGFHRNFTSIHSCGYERCKNHYYSEVDLSRARLDENR